MSDAPAMLLADLADVPADHLKWFLVIVLALATPAATLLGLWLGRRGRVTLDPQPLDVRAAPQLITRELYAETQRAIEGDLEDLKARVTALENGQREMLAKLDERLAEFRVEMSASLRRVHERVDNMPLEMVTLLRNTGAIK